MTQLISPSLLLYNDLCAIDICKKCDRSTLLKLRRFSKKLNNIADENIPSLKMYKESQKIKKQIKIILDSESKLTKVLKFFHIKKDPQIDLLEQKAKETLIKAKKLKWKEKIIQELADGTITFEDLCDLHDDKNAAMAAVKKHGSALKYASDDLKKDKEVVLNAVKNDGYALRYASDDLKKDKEVVLAAVKQNGLSLLYASEELKKDKDVAMAAILQNPHAEQLARIRFIDCLYNA
jgi:hypothetical protein